MAGESKKVSESRIEISEHGFGYWLARPHLGPEDRRRLRQAAVIAIPHEDWQGNPGPYFRPSTLPLIDEFREANTGLAVAVAAADEDYKEIVLLGEDVNLGIWLLTHVAAPLVVAGILAFLAVKRKNRKEDPEISVELFIERRESHASQAIERRVSEKIETVSLKFTGKAEELEDAVRTALKRLE